MVVWAQGSTLLLSDVPTGWLPGVQRWHFLLSAQYSRHSFLWWHDYRKNPNLFTTPYMATTEQSPSLATLAFISSIRRAMDWATLGKRLPLRLHSPLLFCHYGDKRRLVRLLSWLQLAVSCHSGIRPCHWSNEPWSGKLAVVSSLGVSLWGYSWL